MVKVRCPNASCNTLSQVPDGFVGRKVRCKTCKTVFVAAPLEEPARASQADGGVITVVARRVGQKSASGARASVLGKETMLTGGEPLPSSPPAPPAAGKAGMVLAAVMALVLPVLAAGGYVGYQWWNSGGSTVSGAAASAPGETYGGIEIGSSGVKATVIELFSHPEYGFDYRRIAKKSLDTKLIAGLDKTGQFDRAALDDTVNAVGAFFKEMTKEHQLPAERVFIVGGSGLFKPIRDRKDLPDTRKAELTAKNQTALTEAVEKATGKKMDFIDVRKEVELMIDGLVRKKHLSSAVLIDVGTSATRGGYRDPSGLYVTFEAPGAGGFEAKVKEK